MEAGAGLYVVVGFFFSPSFFPKTPPMGVERYQLSKQTQININNDKTNKGRSDATASLVMNGYYG